MAVYSWWRYQLCDMVIEVIKPYFASRDPAFASARKFAQDTLWVCLDNDLRLLHPFMLFITEELWQRLPSRKDSMRKESIVICDYPSPVECWTNEKVEADMGTRSGRWLNRSGVFAQLCHRRRDMKGCPLFGNKIFGGCGLCSHS